MDGTKKEKTKMVFFFFKSLSKPFYTIQKSKEISNENFHLVFFFLSGSYNSMSQ